MTTETKETSPYWNRMLEINAKRTLYHRPFRREFNVTIQRFWDIQTGFDIVKFDEWLKVPDGVSTREFIFQKFGSNAVLLVETLIKL